MGYKFDSEIFEKIICNGIKKNKNQMDFLRANCSQFLKGDKSDKKKIRDFSGFIYSWYLDVKCSICISTDNQSLFYKVNKDISIFNDLINEIFEILDYDGFESLAHEIFYEVKEGI